MAESTRPRPLLLCIVDGFGESPEPSANAVRLASTPELDRLRAEYPTTSLVAAGTDLGLAPGRPGDGYTGHLCLGAGRPTVADELRIDEAIEQRKFVVNPAVDLRMRIAQERKCRLHLFALVSDAGIHSSMKHIYAAIDLADFHEIPVVMHAIVDGRDMPPRSGLPLVEQIERYLEGRGQIGTICGRHYAMDCDERWERTYGAFHAIVRDKVLGPTAPRADTPYDAFASAYGQGQSDDLLVPVRIGDYQGIDGEFLCDFAASQPVWEWTGEEVGLALNFRVDGLRQLSALLTGRGLPPEIAADLLMDRDKPVLAFAEHCFGTLTEYDTSSELPAAFAREPLADTLGEVIAKAGLQQLRVAESEKAAHLTEFFNGGTTAAFAGEQRLIVPSPFEVDSYDEKPAMNGDIVVDKTIAALERDEFDVVVVNLAAPDMVAQTGDLPATVQAVQAVDEQVGKLERAVRQRGGAMLVVSDHGNCERLEGPDAEPHQGHTDSTVPFIFISEQAVDYELRNNGRLYDVAPTMLEILGLEKPPAMAGRSLLQSSRKTS